MDFENMNLGQFLVDHLNALWTFLLLTIRYTVMLKILPGLSYSPTAQGLKLPAVMAFAMVSALSSPEAAQPTNFGIMCIQALSEALFGMVLGLIPLLIVSGAQMAGTLSSTTMGLGASQLIDPTLGGAVPALARLLGDLVVLVFLLSNGHHAIIYAASGLGGVLIPGTFSPGPDTVALMIDRVADVFRLGALIAAPVIVALMLTNFVMGLISKAIPQINVFIVSFPLTIGIGLILTGLSLSELLVLMERELMDVESSLLVLLSDVRQMTPSATSP